jgi:cytochrome c2
MEISRIQLLNRLKSVAFVTLTLGFVGLTNFSKAQGEALFKSKCATCHQTHKNSTGPKLFQVRDKWAAVFNDDPYRAPAPRRWHPDTERPFWRAQRLRDYTK